MRRHLSGTSSEEIKCQFYIGPEPLWAWVCSVLDPQDSINELFKCVLQRFSEDYALNHPVAEEKGASRSEAKNPAGDCLWHQRLVTHCLNSFVWRSKARRDRPRGLCRPLSHFETANTDTPIFLANFSWLRPNRARSLTTSCFRNIAPPPVNVWLSPAVGFQITVSLRSCAEAITYLIS